MRALAPPSEGQHQLIHENTMRLRTAVPDSLELPLLMLAFLYLTLIAIAISMIAQIWSAMHSLALFAMIFGGVPFVFVRAVMTWTRRTRSSWHALGFWLAAAFPGLTFGVLGLISLARR